MNDETLKVAPAAGLIVVRAGGAVLAETEAALETASEDPETPTRWLPLADAGIFLDRTEAVKTIPGVGEARGYDIVAKSGPIPLAAWAVESPAAGAEALKDHVTFKHEKVAVERL